MRELLVLFSAIALMGEYLAKIAGVMIIVIAIFYFPLSWPFVVGFAVGYLYRKWCRRKK
jgi:hypothetical protein